MPGIYSYSDSEAQFTTGLLLSNFKHLVRVCADLIFPPRCSGCGRVDSVWCSRCQEELLSTPMMQHQRAISDTFTVASTAWHEGRVQNALHGLKYENVPALAESLGARLAARLEQLPWNIEVLIPVPLGEARLRERGYNQAQLLAEQLAAFAHIPVLPHALRRQRETRSQVGLNQQERHANMEDAFIADAAQIAGRAVLIIDDVLTTGATLNACAQAALAAGAAFTWGLTVTTARLD